MSIRTRAKRRMRDRERHHVYAAGHKLRRGDRYECRCVLNGVTILSGWFVADSNNPVVTLDV